MLSEMGGVLQERIKIFHLNIIPPSNNSIMVEVKGGIKSYDRNSQEKNR